MIKKNFYDRGIQTITTIGFGDIPTETTLERFYAIFCMVLGVGIYSFSIGNFSNYLVNLNFVSKELKEKIDYFDDFLLKNSQIDNCLKLQIHNFFE